MSSAYPCTQPLVNLRPPRVPQVFNNVIFTINIELSGGLWIMIPLFPDIGIYSTVDLYFSDNTRPIETFINTNPEDLAKVFLLPPEVPSLGKNFTYYKVTDIYGNIQTSPRVGFNIIQSVRLNNFLAATTLSDGAPADGVSQNIVLARLTDAQRYSFAEQLLEVSVTGAAQYPQYVVTDASGSAFIPLTSTLPGVVTVTISLASDPAISASTLAEFRAGNQSICR